MIHRQQIFVVMRDTMTGEQSTVTITVDCDERSQAESFREPLIGTIAAAPTAVLELVEGLQHIVVLHTSITPVRLVDEKEAV